MDVLGVIDFRAGRAVHARGGRREDYRPVAQVAGRSIAAGDAAALAGAFIRHVAVSGLYVADLDAIGGRARQDAAIAPLVSPAVPLWLDQGITTLDAAVHARSLGATRVIVGLETLPSWDRLDEICRHLDSAQVAFSLDVKNGAPLLDGGLTDTTAGSAAALAARAADAGASAVIVLDLARVGTLSGLALGLIDAVREAAPHVTLLAGGGVRHRDDLRRLAAAGCDGALVATALLTGQIGATDVAAAREGRWDGP